MSEYIYIYLHREGFGQPKSKSEMDKEGTRTELTCRGGAADAVDDVDDGGDWNVSR
jgi:hypothetical protein